MSIKGNQSGSKRLEGRMGPMTLASFLKSWRLSEELSQHDFAVMLHMSAANLCDIEKGRKGVSPKKAMEIAKIIGYSPKVMVELVLNDLLRDSGLKFDVTVKEQGKKAS